MTLRNRAGRDAVRPAVGRCPGDRATCAVVGVAVLIGVTLLLASVCGVLLAASPSEPTPTARIEGSATATDGWPDGQRLRLVHRAGDTLAAADLAFVVAVPRADANARLSGFPTRRLTDGNVDGTALFDGSYAGVDGAVDAAHTDGRWGSGEAVEFRIAQGRFDLRSGDSVRIRVIHRPSGGTVARLSLRAT